MTVLGKILAFVNLVFALITMALITMVFISRTNWKAAYDARGTELAKANGDKDAFKEASEAAKAELARRTTEMTNALAGKDKELEQAAGKLAATEAERQQAQKKYDEQVIVSKADKAELARIAAEQKQVETQLTQRDREIAQLKKDTLDSRDSASRFRLLYQNQLARNEVTGQQLAAANRENRAFKDSGATIQAPGAGSPPPVPPVEDVKGRVTAVDGAYVELSIGSDLGLAPNTRLDVFRGGTYLGEVVVVTAKPKAAVGRFQPTTGRTDIAVGDQVGKVGK